MTTIDTRYVRKKEDCTFNPAGEDAERFSVAALPDNRCDDEMEREFHFSMADRALHFYNKDPDGDREITLRIISSSDYYHQPYFNRWGEP